MKEPTIVPQLVEIESQKSDEEKLQELLKRLNLLEKKIAERKDKQQKE